MDEMALDRLSDRPQCCLNLPKCTCGFQLCEYLNSDLLFLAIAHVSTEPQMCTLGLGGGYDEVLLGLLEKWPVL